MTIGIADMKIAIVGAGRMGRGIALSFALAGAKAVLFDLKERDDAARARLDHANEEAFKLDLAQSVKLGLISEKGQKKVRDRITLAANADRATREADLIFEAVPEHRDAKIAAFAWIDANFPQDTLVASTTSTFLVDDIAGMISNPSRFANAHWLNPAHLMPLVEISKGSQSTDTTIDALRQVLKAAGKTTVICGPTPGYIVPRIQALAMNEAARLAEEGAASVEDIDTAIRVGFGVRYAILGLLEFIDWGGGDILYYASDYLSKNVDEHRYAAPAVIHHNMENRRNGVADGKGFYDYAGVDIAAYRLKRMQEFAALLAHLKLTPKISDDAKE